MKSLKTKFKSFFEKYFSIDLPLNKRICHIMLASALIANLYAIITTLSLDLPPIADILSIVCFAVLLVFTIIGFKTPYVEGVTIASTILIGDFIFPMMFFTEGGFKGGMPYYFLMIPLWMSFCLRRRRRFILIFITLLVYVACIVVAYFYPQYVIPIPEDSVLMDMSMAMFIVYLFLYFLANIVIRQTERDRVKIQHLSELYEKQANTDELTGLYNRRYFKEILNLTLPTIGSADNLHIAMFDIDDFKIINDTFGHPYGDDILIMISNILTSISKDGIVACRYGGEEFLILIPGKTQLEALDLVESILEQVRSKVMVKGGKPVTVSAGLQTYFPKMQYGEFLQAVDAKLYQAKRTGKNKVVAD